MARARRRIDYFQIMAAMILGSTLFMIWTAPIWTIREVDIRGTTPYTRKYLEDFLQARSLVGQHLLKLNPLQLKAQILKNPLVRDAQFERELLPTRLTVKVQERKPAHFIYRQQGRVPVISKAGSFILDHEGVVLPLPAAAAPEQLVQVSIRPELIKKKLSASQLDMLRQLEVMAQQKLLPVKGVFDLSSPQNLVLYLADPAVTVWLGRSEDLLIKLKLIQPTLETAKPEISSVDYIDLRFWKHPVIKSR